MTFAPRYPDGYYDDDGLWQRTKFCFVDCGENCTCKEPMFGGKRPVKKPTPEDFTDKELRSIWREAGGDFHGPIIEHGSIKEEDLFVFLRGILKRRYHD